jgi:hypothetical protein
LYTHIGVETFSFNHGGNGNAHKTRILGLSSKVCDVQVWFNKSRILSYIPQIWVAFRWLKYNSDIMFHDHFPKTEFAKNRSSELCENRNYDEITITILWHRKSTRLRGR